jgi:hypothetical protein
VESVESVFGGTGRYCEDKAWLKRAAEENVFIKKVA